MASKIQKKLRPTSRLIQKKSSKFHFGGANCTWNGVDRKENEMQHAMTTTAFALDGYRVTRNLGIVRGIIVRSRSVFGTLGASLQTLVGGNISLFTELCEKTRNDAFELMLQHATQMGANAVLGIRYDATEVMQGVTEVLCYGTAVIVEQQQK
jgi:uncharacterized protein YbjQ (UPF0145 family)